MANRTYIEVTVLHCCTKGEQRVYGDAISTECFASLETALQEGDTHRGEGIGVIVRPNYNESDAEGRFFREWRSFNGEPLKEIRFPF